MADDADRDADRLGNLVTGLAVLIASVSLAASVLYAWAQPW